MLKEVAVSFDDLPATDVIKDYEVKKEITDKLIAVIKRYKIPAIGLVNEGGLYTEGIFDTAKAGLLRQWTEAGLELGNHTFSHIDFYKSTLEEQIEDVKKGDSVISVLLKEKGKPPRYFRYPYLRPDTNSVNREKFERFLKERGYDHASVSIDNSEWIFAGAYSRAIKNNDRKLAERIAKAYPSYMKKKFRFYEKCSQAVFGRNIRHVLLVHANRLNADNFDSIAEMLIKEGYKFVSIDSALSDPAYKQNRVYDTHTNLNWPHFWPLVLKVKGSSFKREPAAPEFIMKAAEVEKE